MRASGRVYGGTRMSLRHRANDFSYSNFTGRDWRVVAPEYTPYERPIMAHESGIIGTYIDLSLESRYTEAACRPISTKPPVSTLRPPAVSIWLPDTMRTRPAGMGRPVNS